MISRWGLTHIGVRGANQCDHNPANANPDHPRAWRHAARNSHHKPADRGRRARRFEKRLGTLGAARSARAGGGGPAALFVAHGALGSSQPGSRCRASAWTKSAEGFRSGAKFGRGPPRKFDVEDLFPLTPRGMCRRSRSSDARRNCPPLAWPDANGRAIWPCSVRIITVRARSGGWWGDVPRRRRPDIGPRMRNSCTRPCPVAAAPPYGSTAWAD